MSTLQHRDEEPTAVMSPFARLDRVFEEWMRTMPMRRAFGMTWEPQGEDVISVDEYRAKG
ncbi:hypothetical protein [Modestobacter sp. VKM Ac-2985]|uniref:hypothetical protein n=1 Tax=Modestobacter sp. VKM Ac-2985 TaxID=3004139 RepID=UPI0022AB9261|nr:hypothetical protein [Modestobacter sp. VKM Ac-2985]MCZ2839160.1 hypothetical protein [Modestobacter sp. VKM Ac-2985]